MLTEPYTSTTIGAGLDRTDGDGEPRLACKGCPSVLQLATPISRPSEEARAPKVQPVYAPNLKTDRRLRCFFARLAHPQTSQGARHLDLCLGEEVSLGHHPTAQYPFWLSVITVIGCTVMGPWPENTGVSRDCPELRDPPPILWESGLSVVESVSSTDLGSARRQTAPGDRPSGSLAPWQTGLPRNKSDRWAVRPIHSRQTEPRDCPFVHL